jgi:hypothetical protein
MIKTTFSIVLASVSGAELGSPELLKRVTKIAVDGFFPKKTHELNQRGPSI